MAVTSKFRFVQPFPPICNVARGKYVIDKIKKKKMSSSRQNYLFCLQKNLSCPDLKLDNFINVSIDSFVVQKFWYSHSINLATTSMANFGLVKHMGVLDRLGCSQNFSQ
ncbi:hypothetical protein CHS0354_034591 [Potamilus streckersoni]|uniref:Uncharacterized protein n=1 Tax=Potamilus streckersoni TaxID=2493646 RepID=A0AAE0SSY7_9BIVA|nr:hypothetical protein CHS0354_034591 [Potamilus streckersoni]